MDDKGVKVETVMRECWFMRGKKRINQSMMEVAQVQDPVTKEFLEVR